MLHSTTNNWQNDVNIAVNKNTGISTAVDADLTYVAINEVACNYLKLTPEALLGKVAIEVFPEVIASRNHRNILRAMSGIKIDSDLVESRMGDILDVSYTPVWVNKEVKAVILNATVHLARRK